MADPLTQITVVLLGAIVGSYCNVLIHRLPPREEQKAEGKRSVCPYCGAPIPGWLNIPIITWLMLRGRARCCGARISPRYVIVESLGALLFWGLVVAPPSGEVLDLANLEVRAVLAFVLHAYFVGNVLANTFIDIEFRLLLDKLNFPLIAVGIAGSLLVPGLAGFIGAEDRPEIVRSVLASIVGAGAGYGVTWGVRWLGEAVFRQPAMGLGDVKLMAGIGAFVGWNGAILAFFLGCVLGAVGGGLRYAIVRDPRLAFGPYLVLGGLLTLFFQSEIIEFLTVTWPEWQRENASSPALVIGVSVASLLALFFLIRRGRASD